MRSRHLAGFHRLSTRSVLAAAVHRGDARIIERVGGFRRMVGMLAGEVGRRQLLLIAAPIMARW